MHADSVETLLPEIWMIIFSYLTKVRFPVIIFDLSISHKLLRAFRKSCVKLC